MTRHSLFKAVAVAAVAILAAPVVAAPSLGTSIRINDAVIGDQAVPAVARRSDGGFVVVWEGAVQDRGVIDIFARRFDATGAALGPSITVNSYRPNRQAFPAVAVNSKGQFVVAWDTNGQDGPGISIYFRRFNADGTPAGAEVKVNDGKRDAQLRVATAIDDLGNVVVAWPERQALSSLATSIKLATLNFRLFDANDAPRGSQVAAEQSVPTSLRIPNVAMATNGDFILTWHSSPTRVLPLDGILMPSGGGIFARRYNASGTALGKTFQVDVGSTPEAVVDRPSLAATADGRFTIAWERITPDYAPLGIFARRYDAGGNALGAEFRVGAGSSLLRYPSVTMDPQGNVTIAAHGGGIFAQRYSSSGAAVGDLVRIDSSRPDFALTPVIVSGDGGNVIVVWQDFGADGDGDGRGISARVLSYP